MSKTLELQISGPSKAIREDCLKKLEANKDMDQDVLECLQTIEEVPPTIHDYRERERHLETLLKVLRSDNAKQSKFTQNVTLRYLVGSLYMNFEKFWGPTVRALITLIEQSKFQDDLLDTVLSHLVVTSDIIYGDNHDLSWSEEERPDHILHRNFLLQLLHKFNNFVEKSHERFMVEFFRFIEKEMLVSPFTEKANRINLLDKTSSDSEAIIDLDDEKPIEIPVKNVTKYNGKRAKRGPLPQIVKEKRKSRETFLTATKIIQSFRDIKSVHRSQFLKETMFDFLCCRDSNIQKAAFNCILVYDDDILRLYADRILKLINDKKVRSELSLFSVNVSDSEQLQHTHRKIVMPVVLRVIFGKMISKLGKKSSGRDKADTRKSLVMRFISGCKTEEIQYFFSILFDPIYKFTPLSYDCLSHEVVKCIDYSVYVPLNKLQAMLSSLVAFIESVAHLQEESLPTVMKIISIILIHVMKPLLDEAISNKLDAKKLTNLKVLRRECQNVISLFFTTFEYYNFEQIEIDFLFENLIWPSSGGFVDRNYLYPTPLLKMIETFARHKTYHTLLIKRNRTNRDEYLLKHLIDLYADDKTQRKVLKLVASILAGIIQPDHESESVHDEMQVVNDIPLLQEKDALVPSYDVSLYRIDHDLELNEKIIMRFIPIILNKLHQNCHTFLSKKSPDYRIDHNELVLLSSLSNYLKDPEHSVLGTKLLLMSINEQKRPDHIVETIKAAQSLMKQAGKNDPTIVKLIADTLGYQRNLEQRLELCKLIQVLSHNDSSLTLASQALCLMNATSEDFVEQPDFVKWNEGFQIAFKYIEDLNSETINTHQLIVGPLTLLINQAIYIINNVEKLDFSVRESCSAFFEMLATKISMIEPSNNSETVNLFIDDIILNKLLKKGLRDTNETAKHTCIGILRSFAIHCHGLHKTLAEFYMFCSQNQDLDFWLGIKHIQMHCRSKALARLNTNTKLEKVSPKTLSTYFMPLASGFLFSKTYKSLASLSENSIKLIGMICKRLNWKTYESTLSYYLGLLTKANATYQRTNIKLITEILKNFNFDITACEDAKLGEEENKRLEERMKKRRGVLSDKDVIITSQPTGKRLNPSTARMVYNDVTKRLIPKLSSCLHEMTRVEFEHDKTMSGYLPEKDEIKRIPIAYAIVQLLNLLPNRYLLLRDNLPALFLKLASFLKSKNDQVRKASRMTLIRIMTFIGPAYIPDMLRILNQNLDKGFYVHVRNYTVHSVLEKTPINYGDLDHSVEVLIGSCMQEIFGKLAEDKEIAQILAKTFEAKKTKSYDTLMILASFIGDEKLNTLISSIKNLLKTSNDSKKVNKLNVCVQKVFSGLSKNEEFPLGQLLMFIRSTIEEAIPDMRMRQKVEQPMASINGKLNDVTNGGRKLREDRYLIEKDFSRARLESKINERGNFHVVLENSLRLLLHTLERNKTSKLNETIRLQLDGFIPLLSRCLKSSSPKCVMRSLKCIYFIAKSKSEMPSFRAYSTPILKRIFILLSLYNGVGMVRGDNLEMIGMCFKTLTLLLLRSEHVQLEKVQIRALMTYIEQDLYDGDRQNTAFHALYSLMKKGYSSPELGDIMIKVADLLITCDNTTIKAISVKVWQIYFLNYKHEPQQLQTHLLKFLRQLDYEFVDGRQSALKILGVVIEKFPESLLKEYYELIFNLFAQRLVNEEDRSVRQSITKAITLLIRRIPTNQSQFFNQFVLTWASDSTEAIKLLGIKLIAIFFEATNLVDSDKEKLKKILSIIVGAIDQNKTSGTVEPTDGESSMRLVTIRDRLNHSSIKLFNQMLDKNCFAMLEPYYISQLGHIWQYIASQAIVDWYMPLVLSSLRIMISFLRKTNLTDSLQRSEASPESYLDRNAKRIVRILCDNLVSLLDRDEQQIPQLIPGVTEGLILLGQLVTHSKGTLSFEQSYIDSFADTNVIDHLLSLDKLPDDGFARDHLPYQMNEAKRKLDLMWLSVKIVMQARKEAALFRLKHSYRRNLVLQWTAAMSQELGPKRIAPYATLFMMTPLRELTDKLKNKSDMTQSTIVLADDLLKFIKNLLGPDCFSKLYSRLQLHYTKKRVERRKNIAVMKVKSQSVGVKRKLKQHKDKGVQRKKVRTAAKMSRQMGHSIRRR